MFGGEEYRVKKVDLGEWEDLRVKYVSEKWPIDQGIGLL